jgi:hypothetical protein
LIRFDAAPQPGTEGVRTAALVVPSFTPQVPAPTIQPATPVAAAVTVKVAAAAPVRVPVAKAVLTVTAATKPTGAIRKQAVAMLDRGLLSDATLGALVSGARNESGRLR